MRIAKFLLCAGLSAGTAAWGQTKAPASRSLSLADCLQIALDHNLDIKVERYNPEVDRYNIKLAYAGYEPTLDLGGAHNFSLSPGGIDQQNRPFAGTTTDTDSFNASVAGRALMGLGYSVGWNVGNAAGLNAFGPFENTAGTASISLSQPLLRNFLIDGTRFNVQIAKQRLKSSEEGVRLQIVTTINQVELVYYDLILAIETVKVQEKAVQLAERTLAENKKRVEVGAMAPLDEKRAAYQYASASADLLSARRSLATQQNILKSLLSDNYSGWQEVSITPSDALAAVPQSFNIQDSWQKGLSLRPELIRSKLELERLGFVLKYQRNQLLPELDLVGSYGHRGSKREFSGAFGDLGEGNSPFWSYGARLSVPLGNGNARNTYRITKAQQEQALLRLKQLEQNIMVSIDDAVQRAQSSFDRVGATRAAREFAEAALEAEERKLESGKGTVFFVLEAQANLTSARSGEASALAEYNKALASLALSEGTTLERHKIAVSK